MKCVDGRGCQGDEYQTLQRPACCFNGVLVGVGGGAHSMASASAGVMEALQRMITCLSDKEEASRDTRLQF